MAEPNIPLPTIGTIPTIPMAAPPEAPKAPELRVPVLDPENNLFTIPENQVSKAVFKDKALTLAPVLPYKAGDINKDGTVNIVSKDGKPTLAPNTEQAQAVLKSNNGYLLKSEYDRFQDPEVQKAYNLLDFGTDKEKQAQTKNLFTVDQDHNFPMINKDGVKIPVPYSDLRQARSAGFDFADPKFQALYDANLYREKVASGVTLGTYKSALEGFVGSVPGFKQINELVAGYAATHPDLPNSARATQLVREVNEVNQEAEKLGNIAGIGVQLLSPTGVFGEVAAAGKVGKAVKGIKALESSPIIASVLGHAAEGAVIAAPQIADSLIKGNPKLAAESLGLGLLGGVVLGELPGALSAGANKLKGLAESAVAERALASLGAEESLLKLRGQAQSKIVDTLVSAGLKESSTVENTFKVLNKVSGGSEMSVLGKLEASGEKILTAPLKAEINGLVQRAPEIGEQLTIGGGLIGTKVSPELEKAVSQVNSQLEKLGSEASLSDIQKLSNDLSEKITRVRAANEVNNFTVQARDLVMEELFKAGDAAALKANPAAATQWAEQKAIAQAATQMQGGFEAQIAAAEKLGNKALTPELADKVVQGGIKQLFHTGITGVGATIGHAILPGFGGWAGGWIGSKLSKGVGGKIGEKIAGTNTGQKVIDTIKPFLDKILPGSSGKNWILKNADNPNVSSYLAMNALHNTNLNLKEIPQFFKGKTIQSTLFAANPDPIKALLGTQANGLSKAQQFSRLSDKVASLAGNEELRAQYLDQVIQVMAKNHPELANGLKTELTNKIMAVNDLMHTGNKGEPQAFQKTTQYQPNKDQMAKIEAGLKVIDNPYVILEGMKNGKVSAQQVALVKQIHPAIYREMVNEINKVAFSGKGSDLTYQQRLSASAITGQPMDPSLKHGVALQANYAGATEQQTNSPSPKSSKQGNSKSIKPAAVAKYTAAQRVTQV